MNLKFYKVTSWVFKISIEERLNIFIYHIIERSLFMSTEISCHKSTCSTEKNSCLKEIFGSNVFSFREMKERLPKDTYKALLKTINEGASLELQVANVVANAMKDWAIEKGATHYTHWFQPLTGITAEKHESFLSPTSQGEVVNEFSGKDLIQGEPDASSFPSGGLRATFEARGYTAWDCTSPAFLKEDSAGVTLCIPTAFCSYTGEVLDKKTPLLRSMEAISKNALRILRLFGDKTTKKISTTVGPEQEYFLINKELFDQRKDLIFTGRTLFGNKPPKGQELEDHYFGSIKERVAEFMKELDTELWKLGVSAKTKHNEVAPSQHELAPVFTTTNIATDHNQLVMETMKKVALRHDLVCLLHEKPFAGVNGSGKHNNWSMSTDTGHNLLEPGKTPHENVQFLLFLCAVIKAVDEYPELLRVSAANPGNDHRLGANEAPPAIISVYLGDLLNGVLEKIESGTAFESREGEILNIGVSSLPKLPKDSSDRNRTSPFAFTGNKFEFRMVPSSASIAAPNFTLNVIVSEVLSGIADRLEKTSDFDKEVQAILKEMVTNHKRVIFNGNNYSEDWVQEAEKRGLPNITNSVDAISAIISEKSIQLFEKNKVMNRKELHSRYEISLENYIKALNIEAMTSIDMAKREILPATIEYMSFLADSISSLKATGLSLNISSLSRLLEEISKTTESFMENLKRLEENTFTAQNTEEDAFQKAKHYRDEVFSQMNALRVDADKLETLVAQEYWPFPTYSEILYSV
jgi:glutamine synthetase